MNICCTLYLHVYHGSNEGLRAEMSAIYIKKSESWSNIEVEDCHEDHSTWIIINMQKAVILDIGTAWTFINTASFHYHKQRPVVVKARLQRTWIFIQAHLLLFLGPPKTSYYEVLIYFCFSDHRKHLIMKWTQWPVKLLATGKDFPKNIHCKKLERNFPLCFLKGKTIENCSLSQNEFPNTH